MSRHLCSRVAIVLAGAALLLPFLAGRADTGKLVKTETFAGKVVKLADLVAKDGGKLDADADPHSLAFVGEDGKVYPLVKDGGSRLFFKDAKLLNRPMKLTGRLIEGTPFLRVMSVHSVVKGQECEVFYWCDICSIRRGEMMICECCGAPMYLREEPVKR
jgi:hypothetical protein